MFCSKGIIFPYFQSSRTDTFVKYHKNELPEQLQKRAKGMQNTNPLKKNLSSTDHTLVEHEIAINISKHTQFLYLLWPTL